MQRTTLQDAVFGGGYTPYFHYRLRFFLIITLTSLAINGVEFFLIKQLLTKNLIYAIIFMRLFLSFAVGGWWGALELLREYVRGRDNFHDRKAINLAVGNWLCLAFVMAALVIAIPMNYLIGQRVIFGPTEQKVYDLYLLFFILTSFLDFGLDAYRSGAYALRRIYRPLTWLLAPSFITLLLLLLLWQLLGLIGLPIAFLLGAILDGATRIYFNHCTYKDLQLTPLQFPNLQQFWKFLKEFPLYNGLHCFLAGLALNIENVLIMLFFRDLRVNPQLLIYLYILRQIYKAYSHWGVMFYFDLKKMYSGPYPPFYNQFLKNLLLISLKISLFFYLIAVLFTAIFYSQYLLLYSCYLLVLFPLASIFSFVSIHAFSQNCYTDLIFSAIIAVGLFLLFQTFPKFPYKMVLALIISMVFVIGFLWRERFPHTSLVYSIRRQSIYTLALKLLKHQEGYQFIRIKTNPKLGGKQFYGFLNSVSLAIHPEGWICPLKTNEILLIEPSAGAKLTESNVRQFEPEMVQSFMIAHVPTRDECLNMIFKEISRYIDSNPFYKEFQKKPAVDWKIRLDQLFKSHFPDGRRVDYSSDDPQLLSKEKDKITIFRSIEDFSLLPLALLKQSPYLAAFVYFPHPVLYVVKKGDIDFNTLASWHQLIHFLNFKHMSGSNYTFARSFTVTKGFTGWIFPSKLSSSMHLVQSTPREQSLPTIFS